MGPGCGTEGNSSMRRADDAPAGASSAAAAGDGGGCAGRLAHWRESRHRKRIEMQWLGGGAPVGSHLKQRVQTVHDGVLTSTKKSVR
jgi:hypothetical protein